jgi:hypothetical protein
LSRVPTQAQLPPEALLDLALDMLEALNRHLAVGVQPVVGLATGRWRRSSAQERSEALRQVAKARGKHREAAEREPPLKNR